MSALTSDLSSQTLPPPPAAAPHPPAPEYQAPSTVTPPAPETIQEAGLTDALIEQLVLKMLYYRGELIGRDLASAMGLRYSLIDSTIETLKRQHMLVVKRSLGMGNSSGLFVLSEAGRALARNYLDSNQYAGPAPVPLYQYTAVVRRQRLSGSWLTADMLMEAFRHMVVSRQILSQIGPAVNSGKSFLIYGQPGNGKTALAESLFRLQTEPIYIPYAIEYQGNIVQVYDPIYHQKIDDDESSLTYERAYDGRWFRSKRPFIITGGELAFDMLDLSYNGVSKIYDAPFQLKANNGIYLIDDFGRQKASPAEVLNRWIVPMERGIDYLSFNAGGKMTVPFEAFLIFSTNLRPEQLGDEAFLRRIQYKMLLRSPDAQEFTLIFHRFCEAKQLPYAPGLIERCIQKHYRPMNKPFRRCHPRDVITHAIDLINFERIPFYLTDEILDRAFESCFIASQEVE
jgi:DNA-binding MarR family transcriptional regulator